MLDGPGMHSCPLLRPSLLAFLGGILTVAPARAQGLPDVVSWSGRTVSHPDGTSSFLGRYPISMGRPASTWARAFLDSVGAPPVDLELVRTEPLRDGAVFELRQTITGLPVRGGFMRATVRKGAINHARFHFHSPSLAPRSADRSARVEAREAADHARRSFAARSTPDLTSRVLDLELVMDVHDGTLHRAWRTEVVRRDPPDRWWVWIDAHTRRVVRRERRSAEDVEGTINMTVDADCQDQGAALRPVPHIEWAPGRYADAEGAFRGTGPVEQAVVSLHSPFFRLQNRAGEVAGPWRFDLTPAPTLNELELSPPLDQATPFYHAHVVRDWMRSRLDVDGGTQKRWSEQQVTLNVNIPQTCNATYNGQINFFQAGNGCTNTGRVATIVYHEYGHGIHDNSSNTFDGQVSEGIADFTAATIRNSPSITGIRGCNVPFRTCDNDFTYCSGGSCDYGPGSQVHASGQVICAVWWELRTSLVDRYGYDEGVNVTDKLFLDFLTAVTSMNSAYEATIAVDEDEDGDPSNGTRHSCEINRAFANHFPALAGRIPDAPSVSIRHQAPGVISASGPAALTFHTAVQAGCSSTEEDFVLRVVLTDASGQAFERRPSPAGADEYTVDLSDLPEGTYTYYIEAELGGDSFYYPNQARADVLRRVEGLRFPPYRQKLFIGDRTLLLALDFEEEEQLDVEACDRTGAGGRCNPGARPDWTWWNGSTATAGGPSRAHSGVGMWVTNPDGTYTRSRRSRLTFPTLDASEYSEVRLQFWRFLINSDVAAVEVNGRRVYDNRAGAFFWRDPVWTFEDLDISPWAGGDDDVEIAFVIDDEFPDTFELGGWHLDDVRVVGTPRGSLGTAADGDDEGLPDRRRPPGSGCSSTGSGPSLDALVFLLLIGAILLRGRWRA